MPYLELPDPRVSVSFRSAMAEFRAEGRGDPDDESMVGHELRTYGGTWGTAAGFTAYVAGLRADADPAATRPAGRVRCTTWWWVHDDEYLGRIAVRHRLNEPLLEWGGHIGYDVRPSARRQGHGTAMLRAVLPRARELGIDSALVTCDPDNIGSRRVIESCGGVLEDERHGKWRYWVPTAEVGRTRA